MTQGNNYWCRKFLYNDVVNLVNDGPLFLADAVNNWDWTLTKSGLLDISAYFKNPSNYRLLVISPDGSNVYYDNTFRNVTDFHTNVYNLNPGQYRILVFGDCSVFELKEYSILFAY